MEKSDLTVDGDSFQHDYTVTFDMGPSTGQWACNLSLIQPIRTLDASDLLTTTPLFFFFLKESEQRREQRPNSQFHCVSSKKRQKEKKDKQNRKNQTQRERYTNKCRFFVITPMSSWPFSPTCKLSARVMRRNNSNWKWSNLPMKTRENGIILR